MRAQIRNLILGTAAVAAVAIGHLAARADGASCTAHLAGMVTGKKTPVELVVFNTTALDMTLDLRILDPEGTEILRRDGGVEVGPRGTAIVSIEEELARDLPRRTKAYSGVIAIELSGAGPFAPETAVVHATQFFGKRKNPKGAVVFRPLYTDGL